MQTPNSPTRPLQQRSVWKHQPALDGLRGLAVLGVVLYHAGVAWLPGGLLGVDAFFVLSGFLITGLLLAERQQSGRVNLRRFWVRRARRLLPALLVLLTLVSVQIALTADAAGRARYPKDALAALAYVANWRFAFTHQGYFGSTTPSPLLHLWSLGVEEQFYVLWPLVVGVLLLRRGSRLVGRVAAIGALASTLLMGWLAVGPGMAHGASTDRLYYGTDTRAAPLLIGAAMAVWQFRRSQSQPAETAKARQWPLSVLGWAALGSVAAVWLTTGGQSGWLYRGGFTLVAIAVGAIVVSIWGRPTSLLARLLAVAPLAALGRISYGVYLFHWPLFLLLDHRRTGLAGNELLLARLLATAAVSILSYRYVESPIRLAKVRLPLPKLTVPAAAGATVGVILLATTLPANAARSQENMAKGAAILQHETEQRLAQLPANPAPLPAAAAVRASARHALAVHEPVRTFIVGDSMAFSAAWALTSERTPYRVDLLSDAIIGCGIMPDPYGDPNSTSPIPLSQCTGWQSQWQLAVQRFQPQVSAVFLGRWEIVDRVENGRVVHIGEPGYDHNLSVMLDRAISLLSARGGKVALIALPCITLPELANGGTSPADEPARAARYNQLLRQAAARHRGVASVIDINGQICPGGQVISSYHGVPLRQSDGMHFDQLSGPALGPLLLEPMRRLAGAPARPRG